MIGHKTHLLRGSPRASNCEVESGILTYISLRLPATACLVVEPGNVGWSRGSASEVAVSFPRRKNPLLEALFRIVLLLRPFRQRCRKDSVLLASAIVDAAVRTVRRRSSGSTMSTSSTISPSLSYCSHKTRSDKSHGEEHARRWVVGAGGELALGGGAFEGRKRHQDSAKEDELGEAFDSVGAKPLAGCRDRRVTKMPHAGRRELGTGLSTRHLACNMCRFSYVR